MTNTQLYLAIGVPVVLNLVFNGVLFLWLHSDIVETRNDLKLLTGKVFEMDNRINRIEDKLGIR